MPRPPALGPARIPLAILAFAVFAAVTTEVLPAGLLPQIAGGVRVPAPVAGLLVTLYAGLTTVLAVPLTLATRALPRKGVLLAAVAAFVVANLLAAAAPGYAVLATARALGGVAHAVFFSVAIGSAARLVPDELTGRALGLVSAGISAGLVLGVPLGTALGQAAGWRSAFVALAAVMAVVLLLAALRLPRIAHEAPLEQHGRRGRGRRLAAVLTANGLFYTGHNVLYTYVAVALLAAGAAPAAVGPVLLGFGAVSLVGVSIAAPRLDHHFRAVSIAVLAVFAAGLLAVGATIAALPALVVAGVVWNSAFGSAAPVFQNAAVQTRAVSADLAGAWVVATSNAGIGGGAALGSLVLAVGGVVALPWAAAVPALIALGVVLASRSGFPQRAIA